MSLTAVAVLRPVLWQNENVSARSRKAHMRRHSYHQGIQPATSEDVEDFEETVLMKLDLFIDELSQRFDACETHLDSGMEMAYETVLAVKDHCGKVGDHLIGRGRRRAEILLCILEQRYHDVLSARQTLPQKIVAGITILEGMVSDIESSSYAGVDRTLRSIERVDSQFQEGADKYTLKINLALLAARDRLLTYDELPIPWQNNEHIIRGYRFCETKLECVKSIVRVHNETANIWSHLVGFVIMLAVGVHFYPVSPAFQLLNTADKVLFFVFIVASLKCLAASCIWHTFNNFSHLRTMQKLACLDYTAISTLIACSILTMEYSGFYCQPYAQLAYMGLTTLIGLVGIIMPWYDWFDRRENRSTRILFYLGLSISGVFPLVHLVVERGPVSTFFFIRPLFKSIASYIVGVIFYANHFPERVWKGVFDWTGGSHCIWHICVFFGIYGHYMATQDFITTASDFACTSNAP